MAPTYLAECASCGKGASRKCTRCLDAPEYEAGDSVDSVYCDRKCQKEHWPNHKFRCHALGQRKKLIRTAKLLKAALLTYREVMYDIDLTKIELANGVLYLYQNQRPITARSKHGPFPHNLTTINDHKEAALTKNQCTLAMALLGRLTRKLLKGIASTIEVVDISIGNPLVPTRLVPGPDSGDASHTVLKVRRLFANEVWILDTAGCQYGFQEVLVPKEKYFATNSCRTSEEAATYDATETKDLGYFSTLPFLNRTRAQRDDIKLERKARLHFAAFVDKHVSVEILDGSAIEFENKLDSLVRDLKDHMLNFGS